MVWQNNTRHLVQNKTPREESKKVHPRFGEKEGEHRRELRDGLRAGYDSFSGPAGSLGLGVAGCDSVGLTSEGLGVVGFTSTGLLGSAGAAS